MHGICGYGTIGDLGTANADHLLHLNIPHLGPQAQDHVPSSRLRELVAKATLHTKPGSGAGKVGSFISTKGQWTSSLSEIQRPSKNQRPYKQIIIMTNPVLTVIFWWSIWNHLPTGSSIWIYASFIRTLRGGALDLHEWFHDTSMELVDGGYYKPENQGPLENLGTSSQGC